MTRILLIDDDEKLGELLKAYFQRFDMQLDNAVRPSEGLMKIQRDKPDIVILDGMIPEQDGFDVCRTIRKTSSIPGVMLTARGDVTDRIVGLEIGAAGGEWYRPGGAGAVYAGVVAGVCGAVSWARDQRTPLVSAGVQRGEAVSCGV